MRAIMSPGVPLLLLTAGHDYQLLTPPDNEAPLHYTAGGHQLTDGHAFSQVEGCVEWGPKKRGNSSSGSGGDRQTPSAAAGSSSSRVRVSLNLTVTAEAYLSQTFRLVSAFRAYFLSLDGAAVQPPSVNVSCSLPYTRGSAVTTTPATVTATATASPSYSLAPVTRYPASGKMVIWDVILPEAAVASTCEFSIERDDNSPVLLAEIEAYA